MTSIEDKLPAVVIGSVLSFADTATLCSADAVNGRWHSLAGNNRFWRPVVAKMWSDMLEPEHIATFEQYVEKAPTLAAMSQDDEERYKLFPKQVPPALPGFAPGGREPFVLNSLKRLACMWLGNKDIRMINGRLIGFYHGVRQPIVDELAKTVRQTNVLNMHHQYTYMHAPGSDEAKDSLVSLLQRYGYNYKKHEDVPIEEASAEIFILKGPRGGLFLDALFTGFTSESRRNQRADIEARKRAIAVRASAQARMARAGPIPPTLHPVSNGPPPVKPGVQQAMPRKAVDPPVQNDTAAAAPPAPTPQPTQVIRALTASDGLVDSSAQPPIPGQIDGAAAATSPDQSPSAAALAVESSVIAIPESKDADAADQKRLDVSSPLLAATSVDSNSAHKAGGAVDTASLSRASDTKSADGPSATASPSFIFVAPQPNPPQPQPQPQSQEDSLPPVPELKPLSAYCDLSKIRIVRDLPVLMLSRTYLANRRKAFSVESGPRSYGDMDLVLYSWHVCATLTSLFAPLKIVLGWDALPWAVLAVPWILFLTVAAPLILRRRFKWDERVYKEEVVGCALLSPLLVLEFIFFGLKLDGKLDASWISLITPWFSTIPVLAGVLLYKQKDSWKPANEACKPVKAILFVLYTILVTTPISLWLILSALRGDGVLPSLPWLGILAPCFCVGVVMLLTGAWSVQYSWQITHPKYPETHDVPSMADWTWFSFNVFAAVYATICWFLFIVFLGLYLDNHHVIGQWPLMWVMFPCYSAEGVMSLWFFWFINCNRSRRFLFDYDYAPEEGALVQPRVVPPRAPQQQQRQQS